MAKESPKQPQPSTGAAPESVQTPAPAKPKAPPVKNTLPPDAVKRMREFYKDSYEIERQFWRLTY